MYPPGVVVTTSGIAKFYSNGLDLEHVQSTPGFWKDSLVSRVSALKDGLVLTFGGVVCVIPATDHVPNADCCVVERPWVRGRVHGGYVRCPPLSLCSQRTNGWQRSRRILTHDIRFHDYRCMNPHKGYLCLNELELGVPLRPPMLSIFRQKLSAATVRRMILEAYRFKVRTLIPSNSPCNANAHLGS